MQGHLKEQDEFFQYILAQLAAQGTMSPEKYDAVFSDIEGMIQEHIDKPEGSKLSEAVPTLKAVHTPLPLTEALAEYDDHTRVRQRKFVPMTFKEVRHVVNIATVKVVAPQLRLLCLDADETCYSDGGTITPDSPMIPIITSFIRAGITVCLVTAAGYANAPGKYEHRLRGLLDAFQFAVNMGAPSDAFQRHFYVMGGEANYLHRLVVSRKGRLQLAVVPGEEWKNGRGVRWSLEGIRSLLDIAEDTLRERAAALGLAVQFIRKERAVGMIRAGDAKFPFEVLEEVALAVQAALKGHPVPHCAFNGGQDCWVDVGNKALGIRAVQAFLSPKANASNTVHVGDRFTRTGNDTHSRDAASTLWISNPRETRFFLHLLLRAVVRTHPKVAAVTAEAVAPIAPIKPPGTAAAAMSAGVSGWVSQGDDTPVTSGAADLPQHAAAALGVSTRPRTPEQGDAAEEVRRPYTPDVLPAQEGDHVSPLVQAVAAPPPGTMAPLALPVAAPSASRVRSALDADGGVVVGAEAGRAPPVGATRRLSLAGSGEGSDSDDDVEGGTSAVDLDMSWLE